MFIARAGVLKFRRQEESSAEAAAGNRKEAEKVIGKLTESSKHDYLPSYPVAQIYAELGLKDEAFKWLDKAYQERAICRSSSRPCARPAAFRPAICRLVAARPSRFVILNRLGGRNSADTSVGAALRGRPFFRCHSTCAIMGIIQQYTSSELLRIANRKPDTSPESGLRGRPVSGPTRPAQ